MLKFSRVYVISFKALAKYCRNIGNTGFYRRRNAKCFITIVEYMEKHHFYIH